MDKISARMNQVMKDFIDRPWPTDRQPKKGIKLNTYLSFLNIQS